MCTCFVIFSFLQQLRKYQPPTMNFACQACKRNIDSCRSPALAEEQFGGEDLDHTERRKLIAALCAEFLGLLIFQLYGGEAHESVAAFGNGLTLAVCVYATANISGGHLNPAVTLATIMSGHIHWKQGLLYMLMQFLGGAFGALFQAALMDNAHVGMGNSGPGCFTHLGGVYINKGQLFGWELIMVSELWSYLPFQFRLDAYISVPKPGIWLQTFVLVFIVYSCCISKPGFGNIGPLMVGYTLFASAFVVSLLQLTMMSGVTGNLTCLNSQTAFVVQGGPMTGTAINPARVFGPALVFNCYWNTAFIYIAAQFCGGIIAALLALPLWGPGDAFIVDQHEQQSLHVEMAPTQPTSLKASSEMQSLVNIRADSSSGPQWKAQFWVLWPFAVVLLYMAWLWCTYSHCCGIISSTPSHVHQKWFIKTFFTWSI